MNKVRFIDDDHLKVELGCGDSKHWRPHHIHLDINDNGQDIVWDITKGLPFRDNSCEQIYASHCFEHISQQDLITVLNECWRVLHKDGVLWVIVPHRDAESGYIIPHVTKFDENTFRHLTLEMNDDYTDLTTLHSKTLLTWRTLELVTNERPDIHWKATPEGKL